MHHKDVQIVVALALRERDSEPEHSHLRATPASVGAPG